jgi:hypothetical protein
MVSIEQLSRAAVNGEALQLRVLAQEWLEENQLISAVPAPTFHDQTLLAVAASLAELFAERAGEKFPEWTAQILPAPEPIFLLREARTMKNLRKMCQEQSPAALRRRRLFAPPNLLEFA